MRPELLAPAGDLLRCKTAIRYGADAVYLGGQSFSLRSRASNFSLAEIKEACDFAGQYGARIHVTVNIIPHEEDYDGLVEYLTALRDAGVTAVIVASVSIMELCRQTVPELEVHCSTQMSVTNAETALFLKKNLGIDRVVLARECTMDDVRAITKGCRAGGIETEAFIHGGMCVNYSGRCTLSNRMTLRDANRGGCAQSCRWFYRLYDEKKELTGDRPLFTMGSRDLNAADEIVALMNAGVTSFKIEGRMKTEYYVASTVSGYRHLIDEILENGGPLSAERMAYHRAQIAYAENREVFDGFYPGIADEHSIIFNAVTDQDVNHQFLGTIVSYDETAQTAVLQTRNPFEINEMIEVLSPGLMNRTFYLTKMRTDKGERIDRSRHPMAHITIPVPFSVSAGDILRRYRNDD